MFDFCFKLLKPSLFKMDAEQAHHFVLNNLSRLGCILPHPKHALSHSFMGLDFPNKIGMAAGFDKNAIAIKALLSMGFGFVEIGTVTPLPQAGNPLPRLFRLAEDEAIINRMGFNNDGAEVIAKRLQAYRASGGQGIVGVNIGANKDSEDKIKDYALVAEKFLETASYFTVNVSSPNTQGLRDLQQSSALYPLLDSVIQMVQKSSRSIPILLKIAPDLMQEDLEDIADTVNHLPITGIIISNTTIQRFDILQSEYRHETGGLSGKPLFELSTTILRAMRDLLYPEKIVMAAGGIHDIQTAREKYESGANLLQIYTSFIYQGPALVKQLAKIEF